MTYIVRFNSEDQGSHGTLCFSLIDIIYIFKMQNTLENPDLHTLLQPGHIYH